MSDLGKQVRLRRLFSHPSGRILAIAADHMINYPIGMPAGLRNMARTIEQIVEGQPSSLTINKGIALRYGQLFAGRVPLIVQMMALTPNGPGFADHAAVEEVVAMGADAVAVSMFVKREDELALMRHLAHVVRQAGQWGLLVIPHIYPLVQDEGQWSVSTKAEDLFYAARVGVEMGADVIKIPFTGDAESFRDLVSLMPVPIVTAGGPKCETLEAAEAMMREVAASGAAGSAVGRNVWGFSDIPEAIRRLKEALFEEASCAAVR